MLVIPISNFKVKDLQSEAHEQTANKACLVSQSFSHGAILVIVPNTSAMGGANPWGNSVGILHLSEHFKCVLKQVGKCS